MFAVIATGGTAYWKNGPSPKNSPTRRRTDRSNVLRQVDSGMRVRYGASLLRTSVSIASRAASGRAA